MINMKTKITPKTKTRTGKSKDSSHKKLQWLLGSLVILIVAIIGIVVMRYSQASNDGWCDRHFSEVKRVNSATTKLACYFAVDDQSTRAPNKVQTNAKLVNWPDNKTNLSGPEAWYFDSENKSNLMVWSGPSIDFPGTKGKTVKACWWVRNRSGDAKIKIGIKSTGQNGQEKWLATSSPVLNHPDASGYQPYCVSTIPESDLKNANFQMFTWSGRVFVNRMTVESTPKASTSNPSPGSADKKPPIKNKPSFKR